MRRVILLIILGLLVSVLIWQRGLLSYGMMQARGQWRVVSGAKPVQYYLDLPDYPDSLKAKLRLIQHVRQYAFDSLGINQSDNYTTMYDQQGKAILWNLSACEPYALKAKTWDFPVLGSFSYKGFFNLDRAREERAELDSAGYDTGIRVVSGWSTLGWFSDPVLSNMLNRSDGRLAELIIHELTHGTLFVKDSLAYNENLATFIGERGARKFLLDHYGTDSSAYYHYVREEQDYEKYASHFINGAHALDSLYQAMEEEEEKIKAKSKEQMISTIVQTLDTINFYNKARYLKIFEERRPNNTYFMSFLRYRSKQDNFEEALQRDFDGDLKAYLTYLKAQYPSL